MDIPMGTSSLRNLNKINIILGKNGCGKSSKLRLIESTVSGREGFGKIKYITPERGGTLTYEAGVEQSIASQTTWLPDIRRRNQVTGFRPQSVAQYKTLELLVLREIAGVKRQDTNYTFDLYLEKINSLLDNIEIKSEGALFKIYKKDGVEINADVISSGESELISLGIECLVFSKECIKNKDNLLLLDEPDVHLHPDLQVRLIHFLKELTHEYNFRVIIATHSTAILGGLEDYNDAHIVFMKSADEELIFNPISEIYRKILPIFGAHPLSNIFNQAPILLVEGEDDERIWQQAVRSSRGRIKLCPCSVDSITHLNDFELEAEKIIQTVYDNAKGYSLRDQDDSTAQIADLEMIIRMKLGCRNAENLLLADEVLTSLDTTWDELKNKINLWIEVNVSHPHCEIMQNFRDGGFDRKEYNIKEIRNDLMGIMGSSKPWEVAVGQAISQLVRKESNNFHIDGKLFTFLGRKVVENLIPKSF